MQAAVRMGRMRSFYDQVSTTLAVATIISRMIGSPFV